MIHAAGNVFKRIGAAIGSGSRKLMQWALFVVAVAVIPVLANVLILAIFREKPDIVAAISRGELLLASLAIAADAAGEFVREDTTLVGWARFCAGCCILIGIVSAFAYGSITSAEQIASRSGSVVQVDTGVISLASQLIFVATVIASFFCKLGIQNKVVIPQGGVNGSTV